MSEVAAATQNAVAPCLPDVTAAQAAACVTQAFERIYQERMQGLPLINVQLAVATPIFAQYQGRQMGIVITPWMMSLIRLPNAVDAWEKQPIGDKQTLDLPNGPLRFMVNDIDGIGRCQMASIYSPMHGFRSMAEAQAAARDYWQRVMQPASAEDIAARTDEELLGRILRGEEAKMPVEIDPLAAASV